MKKIILIISLFVFGIIVSIFVINSSKNEIINYTVEFDTSGGTYIEKQIVKQNEFIKKPNNPTKPGYKFLRWEYNNQEFDFNTKVSKDMIISAVWEKSNTIYKVELILEDQKQILEVQDGSIISDEMLNFKNKEGYIIEWYYNSKKININNTRITKNITLIGKYEKEKMYTITFDTDGGTKIENQKIKENGRIVEPNNPTKSGYIFNGWYLDNKKYDFKDLVTKDIILKAHWKKNLTKNPLPEKLILDKTEEKIEIGEVFFLVPRIEPKNVNAVKIIWKSSNPDIASVDENGKVVGKMIGETKIKAQTENGVEVEILIKVISKNRIHFLKTNTNGNAILLESEGKFAMIDAGGSPSSGISSCNDNIVNYLNNLNVKELEYVIISHYHWDHVYCLSGQDEISSDGFLLRNSNIKVKKIIIKDYNLDSGVHSLRVVNFYNRITSSMNSNDIIKVRNEGENYSINNFNISLYNTSERFSKNSPEDNDNANSLVAVVEYNKNNKKLLAYIPGDIQNTTNAGNIENIIAQSVAEKYNRVFDLYVASHHGYSSNNPNSAIGNKEKRIQFKNAIVTNTFENFCDAMSKQSSAANALSRIYLNMQRNTNSNSNNIYFDGRKNVITHFTDNGMYITGGELLICTYETCKDGTETAKTLRNTVIQNGEVC